MVLKRGVAGHFRRSGAPATALALLSLAAGACGSSETTSTTAQGCLFTDPVSHRVLVYGCSSSAECPEGTVCQTGSSDVEQLARWSACSAETTSSSSSGGSTTSTTTTTSSTETGVCVATTLDQGYQTALFNGFNVQELKLTQPSGASAQYTFDDLPTDTELVYCAIFGGTPVIQSSTTSFDAAGHAVLEMVNFDQAILKSHYFAGQSSQFSLAQIVMPEPQDDFPTPGEDSSTGGGGAGGAAGAGGSTTTSEAPVFEKDCTGSASCPRDLTIFAVGCWVYDSTSLIGATKLYNLALSSVPGSPKSWLVESDGCIGSGTGENNGTTCVIATTDKTGEYLLGSCRDGSCVQRCTVDSDCTTSGTGGSGGMMSGTGGSGGMMSGSGGAGGSGTGGASSAVQHCYCPKLSYAATGQPYLGQCAAEDATAVLIDSDDCKKTGAAE